MKNRIVTGLLCICMMMAFLPAGAVEAADHGAVVLRHSVLDLSATDGSYVSTSGLKTGVNFTNTSVHDSAEGWSWDVERKTLTLSGAQIEGSSISTNPNDSAGIKLPASTTVTIVLAAGTSSKVQGGKSEAGGYAWSAGIESRDSDIIISGSGSLEVSADLAAATGNYAAFGYGIVARSTVIGEDATVAAAGGATTGNVSAYSAGIRGDLAIKDNASVTAIGGVVTAAGSESAGTRYVESHGIDTYHSTFEISGNAHLVAKGGNTTDVGGGDISYSSGVYSKYIIVKDNAAVEADGGIAIGGQGRSCGLFGSANAGNNILISDNAAVTASGGLGELGSTGILVANSGGVIAISDNAIVAAAGKGRAPGSTSSNFSSIGIYSEKVIIGGGQVTASGNAESETEKALSITINGFMKISPDTALKMKIAVKTGDNEAGATAITGSPFSTEQDITELVQNKKYFQSEASTAIAATPNTLDFGRVYPGYSKPQEKTVTIKNQENRVVTLNDTASDTGDFIISGLSSTTLQAGAEATFTVQPKANLKFGTYTGTITITGDNDAEAVVSLSFVVEEKAIVAGVNSSGAKTIWFGKNGSDPIAWRVVGFADEGVAPTSGGITLLSKEALASTRFAWTDTNVYSTSLLKEEMEKTVADFSESERAAINPRDLLTGAYHSSAPYSNGIAGEMVSDALLWPLSTAEANDLNDSIRKIDAFWWLRSPGSSSSSSAYVDSNGIPMRGGVQCSHFIHGIRPAFHLKQDSIIFSSAADDGKTSGPVGKDALKPFADGTPNELKLTVYDEAYNSFNVSVSVFDGKQASLSYTGATVYHGETAPNEYISALVKNEIGEITHYGKIVQPASQSGTAKVNLPDGFDASKDKLYVFSEQCNGDKMTDYAGALKILTLTENAYPVIYELSNLTTDGASYWLYDDTQAYTGTLIAASGYDLPEAITVKISGSVLGKGEYTYSNSNGELAIPRDKITGPVTVTAAGKIKDYAITATAEKGGSISPSGDVSVSEGGDQTFTITAEEGYVIFDVLVDGKSVGAVATYTFENISQAHTITAKFAEKKAEKENPFTDISESDWFYNNVMWAYENDLMKGTDNTIFSPNAATTRGMAVTILYRLEGATSGGENKFTDVKAGMYYANAVAWAAANGIVKGYGNGLFGPNDHITREQMALIMMNYAKFKGYEIVAGADISKYADAGTVSGWAKEAMAWANAEGLIQGSGSKLEPTANAMRAQVAAILNRFVEKLVK